MIQKIKLLIASTMMLVAVAAPVLMPADVSALDPADAVTDGVNDVGGTGTGPNAIKNDIKTVVNVLMFILGAIAVIMIVVGGIRYATSGGDSSQITAAKNTILYAIIGVVVAMLAYAIVNWVIDRF